MYLEKRMFPKDSEFKDELHAQTDVVLLNGGSALIAPDDSYVVEPVYGKEKLIRYGDRYRAHHQREPRVGRRRTLFEAGCV
jgi:hypothetical protein